MEDNKSDDALYNDVESKPSEDYTVKVKHEEPAVIKEEIEETQPQIEENTIDAEPEYSIIQPPEELPEFTEDIPNEKEEIEKVDEDGISVKKKKKRSSSILKGLGIDQLEVANAENEEDSNQRYHSSRAAAAVAKSKLGPNSSRTYNRTSSTNPSELTSDSVSTVTAPVKKKGGGRWPAKQQQTTIAPPALEWVFCEKCQKWRSIAPHISLQDLPDIWYCSMNTWSEVYNSCEAPEEVFNNDEQTPEPIENNVVKSKGKGGRMKRIVSFNAEQADEQIKIENEIKKSEDGTDITSSNAFTPKKRGGNTSNVTRVSSELTSDANVPESSVNWVQCNRCKKWRKVPPTIAMESLPDRWYCSQNTWNPLVAACKARQEEDDTSGQNQEQDLSAVSLPSQTPTSGKGRRGYHSQSNQNAGGANSATSFNNVNNSNNNANTPKQPGVKEIHWVQCEKKNCKKWRKVPAHINLDSFPEKWFCSMNTWDPDSASCDIPEDSDSDNEKGGSGNTRAQLVWLNSKGAATLSYRRIIFGNDGKVKPIFRDKNVFGYGIFSYIQPQSKAEAEEGNTEHLRRLSYWWSSFYTETHLTQPNTTHTPHPRSKKALAAATAEEPVYAPTQLQAHKTCYFPTISFINPNEVHPSEILHEEESSYSFSLLNTARRLSNLPTSSIPSTQKSFGHSLYQKAWKDLSETPLYYRIQAECAVIRSCFLASGVKKLLITKLIESLQHCHFQNRLLEACRIFLRIDDIKTALHRMELNNEVELFTNAQGQFVITILPSIDNLITSIASLSKKFDRIMNNYPTTTSTTTNNSTSITTSSTASSSSAAASIDNQQLTSTTTMGEDEKYLNSKPGIPLKLRKFFHPNIPVIPSLLTESVSCPNINNYNNNNGNNGFGSPQYIKRRESFEGIKVESDEIKYENDVPEI